LVVYSVAVQGAGTIGPCQQAKKDAGEPMPGKFIPQCTKYGFFQPAQCHGSTGKCWCVNPDTGVEVEGSATIHTAPQCTMCYIKRADALRPTGIFGHYAPVCGEDGLFDATQRHGSTGQSWCVNRYTGEEIPNTRVGPGQQRSTSCSAAAIKVGLNMHSLLQEQGPCYAKTLEARGLESMPGFYTPGCTASGYYKTEQHHSSTGYTWCVNPATGSEIKGTRRGPGQPKITCGACFKEIEEKLSRKPMLGASMSQCNDENGDYLPIQHHEGYSWCANPKTGAVEGKKILPGDNTPLPCVNA
jgi:hypothetical protein